MPFGNSSINPYPILKRVNNMRDSYYYKELTGVVYDTLDNYGMPLEEPESQAIFHPLLIGSVSYYIPMLNDLKHMQSTDVIPTLQRIMLKASIQKIQ